MKEIIRRLLREAIDKQSYEDWLNKISDGSRYRDWARRHNDEANRYWALYSHLYSDILQPIGSKDELARVSAEVMDKLKTLDEIKAFKMFILYKEDVLDGILEEGVR